MKNTHVLLLLSLALIVGCASEPSTKPAPRKAAVSPSDVHFLSDVDRRPAVVRQGPPVYPFELRRREIQGQALVEFIVSPEGDVQDAVAIRATHAEFAMAAVECVREWKFNPAIRGGQPVYVRMQVPIVFSLNVGRR